MTKPVIILLLIVCAPWMHAEALARDYQYWLNIEDTFGLIKYNDSGWILAQQRHPRGYDEFIDNIKTFALHDRVIFGSTQNGYFIFECPSDPSEAVWVDEDFIKKFESQDIWEFELLKSGITTVHDLNNPSDIISTRKSQEVRPWAYDFFNNFLGLSDMGLCLLFFVVIMIISVFVGFYNLHISFIRAEDIAVILGFFGGLPILLVGVSGADMACGMYLYPLLFCPLICKICAKVGILTRNRYRDRTYHARIGDNDESSGV